MPSKIIGSLSYKNNIPILSNTMLIKTIKENIPKQTLLLLEKTSQPKSLYFSLSLLLFSLGLFLVVKGIIWFTPSFLISLSLLYLMVLSDLVDLKLHDGTFLKGYQPFGINVNQIFVDNPKVFYISTAAVLIGLLFLSYFVKNSLPFILSFFTTLAFFSDSEMKKFLNSFGFSNVIKLVLFVVCVVAISFLFKVVVNSAFVAFYSILGGLYITSGILNVLIWSNEKLGFGFPNFEAFSAMYILIHALYISIVFYGVYKQMIEKNVS